MSIRLFVGGHSHMAQGEQVSISGDRMFTAAHAPPKNMHNLSGLNGLLDSGAFTDPPHKRLTPDQALDRQFAWEDWAMRIWHADYRWQASGFVSYDLLIDETWVSGEKFKRRWDIRDAETAVTITINAAHYLASQRERVNPRTLILSCQGVDAIQYEECAIEILKVAQPQDWFGLGGWCILGRQRRWMPTFWQTLYRVLPLVSNAGIKHVHIFGVLYQPALGGLLWLADRYNLTVSTDSTAPVLACTWKDKKKSGARREYWRDNVQWWIDTLSDLRNSEHYRKPPYMVASRQLALDLEQEQTLAAAD